VIQAVVIAFSYSATVKFSYLVRYKYGDLHDAPHEARHAALHDALQISVFFPVRKKTSCKRINMSILFQLVALQVSGFIGCHAVHHAALHTALDAVRHAAACQSGLMFH